MKANPFEINLKSSALVDLVDGSWCWSVRSNGRVTIGRDGGEEIS